MKQIIRDYRKKFLPRELVRIKILRIVMGNLDTDKKEFNKLADYKRAVRALLLELIVKMSLMPHLVRYNLFIPKLK